MKLYKKGIKTGGFIPCPALMPARLAAAVAWSLPTGMPVGKDGTRDMNMRVHFMVQSVKELSGYIRGITV